jgi:hypothetical protein
MLHSQTKPIILCLLVTVIFCFLFVFFRLALAPTVETTEAMRDTPAPESSPTATAQPAKELPTVLPFKITDVRVADNSYLISGPEERSRIVVTWQYMPGFEPENAFLEFLIVDEEDAAISGPLRGAGAKNQYKSGVASLGIAPLCSLFPSGEDCSDDDLVVDGAAYRLKVYGTYCADGVTIPGYCDFYNTELVKTEAVYSNPFRLIRESR